MSAEYSGEDKVGEEELRHFTKSLESWGASLNAGEHALLQLVLERAAGRGVSSAEEADFSFPAAKGFGNIVQPFLQEIVRSGALNVRLPDREEMRPVRGWVEACDPWVQGA
jgi:hypothetical protein